MYTANNITDTTTTAGTNVTYTLTVMNTGDVSLRNVSVDIIDAGYTQNVAKECAQEMLGANGSYNCNYVHTLTQPEVDSGMFTSIATTTALYAASSCHVDISKTLDISWTRTPQLHLTKAVEPIHTTPIAGQTEVPFRYVVTNIGAVTITSATVSDPAVSEVLCDINLVNIAPSTSVTCSATHIITQADLDVNTHTSSGCVGGFGPSSIATPQHCVSASFIPINPSLDVRQNTIEMPYGYAKANDRVCIEIEVENTGNMELSDINVVDTGLDVPTDSMPASYNKYCVASDGARSSVL